ncbi:hypothetical protein FACS1894133_5290 [Clostridia bacterium]|nr:hypothetical protein FACS1894133_5290 [Clostridia bacterium]
MIVYVLLGLFGLPVFANGGGIGYIFQPSFGYLIGFVLGTYATGAIAHKTGKLTYKRLLAANFTGLLIVYACGTAYCYLISNFYLGTGVTLWPLFLYCVLLPIPGDIVLCVLSIFPAKRLIPVIGKMG